MASKCEELTESERLRLVGMIADGVSWRQLAKEFDIPATSIRLWAKLQGVGRSPALAKKSMVDALLIHSQDSQLAHLAHLAQCANPITTGNSDVDAAANRDAKVVRSASDVAASVIRYLQTLIKNSSPDAKECVAIVTANEKAIFTYTRINKLDDAPQEKVTVKWVGSE